ncbi:matrixin family metalloprotease [Thioalkalivibrio halophilus]|uniref:Peptidase M10 metallopeptidase domain-containing protein n=1 Tax=Thioalkalivibrio halophilus TaxID=252474 RepID=A0A1V2ZZ03_9GAMM|nr:matrixin family metalloprotease [Thioalkalivibrio halophilus]OOC10334.1 hypothetical protein B1A74_05920 [Thioalkalivibrio halophilus]
MTGRWWLPLVVVLVAIGGWRELVEEGAEQPGNPVTTLAEHPVAPGCRLPVSFHLDRVDAEFGLSEREVRAALRDARGMWEETTDAELFREEEGKGVAVRLVFDERQAAALRRDQARTGLEELYAEIERRRERLDHARSALEADIRRHDENRQELAERQAAHQRDVASWNAGEGRRTEARRARLEREAEAIERQRRELNRRAERLGERRDELEDRRAELDAAIADYNARADGHNERSREASGFNVGLYERSGEGRSITVYQATDREQLTLVLAHELGHALGIGHVADPAAVMYASLGAENAGRERLAEADRRALEQACDVTTGPTGPTGPARGQ